jgi:hypothetical protein
MARKLADTIALQVRMTEALRRKLASAAEKNARSLNSEILWRLGQTLDEEGQQAVAEIEDQEKRDEELLERFAHSPALKKVVDDLIAGKFADKKGKG